MNLETIAYYCALYAPTIASIIGSIGVVLVAIRQLKATTDSQVDQIKQSNRRLHNDINNLVRENRQLREQNVELMKKMVKPNVYK